MKTRRRFWKTGWALVVLGLVMGGGFWGYVVPVLRGIDPSLVPHLSPQGFWEAKERALKLGSWQHDDGWLTGYFGGKEWVETIIGWLQKGKEIEGCPEGHRTEALAIITNHEVAEGKAYAAEWQRWWEANQGRTQEEWIQQGFAELGITVALPPSNEDWPKLLGVLGASAGASERSHRDAEDLYPGHVRHNAYRWLRDSGFDPWKLVMSEEAKQLSVEQRAGLRVYPRMEMILCNPSPPGRLAFAQEDKWGPVERLPTGVVFLKGWSQAVVTGVALLLVVGGLGLLGVRVSLVRREG